MSRLRLVSNALLFEIGMIPNTLDSCILESSFPRVCLSLHRKTLYYFISPMKGFFYDYLFSIYTLGILPDKSQPIEKQ